MGHVQDCFASRLLDDLIAILQPLRVSERSILSRARAAQAGSPFWISVPTNMLFKDNLVPAVVRIVSGLSGKLFEIDQSGAGQLIVPAAPVCTRQNDQIAEAGRQQLQQAADAAQKGLGKNQRLPLQGFDP